MTERKKKKRNTRNVKSADQYFDYSMLAVLIFLICFGLVLLFSSETYLFILTFIFSTFPYRKENKSL